LVQKNPNFYYSDFYFIYCCTKINTLLSSISDNQNNDFIINYDKPKLFDLLNDNEFNKNPYYKIEELIDKRQIINGKEIIFPNFCGSYIEIPLNTKEAIKEYIFDYIITHFPYIKKCSTLFKIRLNKDDKRKCAWVLFKRCKFIFNGNKLLHNKVIYNMDDDEEKDIFEEYLKLKKLNSPQKFEY
jgi:hypothetical protein